MGNVPLLWLWRVRYWAWIVGTASASPLPPLAFFMFIGLACHIFYDMARGGQPPRFLLADRGESLSREKQAAQPERRAPAPALSLSAAGVAGELADVGPVPPALWLRWVDEAPHVILAAKTGGGKSTTAKAILGPRIAAGEAVYVIDPHASAWFGLPSVGGGEDWHEVRAALEAVHAEYQRRMTERTTYNRRTGRELPPAHFPRLTVLLDEANITQANIDKLLDGEKRGTATAWERFAKTLGSGARKVRISVVMLAQSALVEDLGLSGSLRENFTRLALDPATIRLMVREERDPERRKAFAGLFAGVAYPATMEREGQVYALDRTGLDREPEIDGRACAWAPGYAIVKDNEADDDLMSLLLEGFEDGNDEAGEMVTAGNAGNDAVTASGRAVTTGNGVTVTPTEAAKIATLLASLPPSEVAKQLPGYSPRKYTAYREKVDAVVALLDS